MNPMLVFDTTHHAVWAEQIILDAGLAAEILPAPSDAKAKCSLAIAYMPDEETAVFDALDRAGAPYRRYG